MSTEPRTSVDALLGRLDRVKSLARRLVRDAAEADDLVQEAVAAALARPTTVHGDGDGWITTTLRNLMRDRARREGRRDRREKATARPEGSGRDTRVLVENAERQRDVVEAVLSLEDPYRETLLMRFFEDLPPREIVKRTGRTPAAVKKHLDRGLAQVRAKLERQYGDRGQWAVALLPVIGTKGLTKLGVAGAGAAVPPSYVLRYTAVLAVVLGIGVPSYVMWRGAGSPEGDATNVEVVRVEALADDAPLAAITADDARDAEAQPAGDGTHAVHEVDEAAADLAQFYLGTNVRFFDLTGAPIADRDFEWTWASRVTDRDGEPYVVTVHTDERGAAVLRGPSSPDLDGRPWHIDGRAFAVAAEFYAPNEKLLVLAPAVRVAGRVVDAAGEPVPNASVTAWNNVRALPSFPDMRTFVRGAQGTGLTTRRQRTDARGEFEFETLPGNAKFQLSVDVDGRFSVRIPMPEVDVFDLEIEAGREIPIQRSIAGVVVESTGGPVPGAEVTFGLYKATADALGKFEIQVPRDPMGQTLAASAADGRFVIAPSPVDSDVIAPTDVDGVVPDSIVLRIPIAMQPLRGRLVDVDGDPVPGVDVLLFDGTFVGGNTGLYETGGSSQTVETDADGAFEFPYCADRPYSLRFIDTSSMFVHDARPLEPGPAVHEVTLPDDALVEVLAGRVVDVHGEPVRGARVRLQAAANGPEAPFTMYRSGRGTTTDDEGRFEIDRAPWRHLSIHVQARLDSGSPSVSIPIGDRRPDDPLELEVEMRCRVHASVDRDDVVRIEARSASGARLNVICIQSGIVTSRPDVLRAENGTFPLFDVSQYTAEFVLIGTSGEIDRVPVRLDVSEQNDVVL